MSNIDFQGEPPSRADGPTLELPLAVARGPHTLEIGSPTHGAVLPLSHALVIGSSRRADVCVEDRSVSARHVRLCPAPEGVRMEDLHSRNGVLIGGERVPSALLQGPVSSFVIGRTTITVRAHHDGLEEVPKALPVPGLLGESLPMLCLRQEIHRVARLRASVLLQGESGSGKDVVARALHELSGRPGQYVPLNVGAVPESLADAELFGHLRGAFTGAVAARPGAFETAHRGTLFLDEIADLSPSIQVKLLRAVEEGRVRPIGSNVGVDAEVRVVSAAWASLGERVSAGRFREDLYHRLATFTLLLPPLRARKSDVPALAHTILRRLEGELGPKEVGTAALARLLGYPFPGNVRELAAVLYRAAACAPGREILSAHVDKGLAISSRPRPPALCQKEALVLLDEHVGNVSAAARAVGVPRSTFRAWVGK